MSNPEVSIFFAYTFIHITFAEFPPPASNELIETITLGFDSYFFQRLYAVSLYESLIYYSYNVDFTEKFLHIHQFVYYYFVLLFSLLIFHSLFLID